MGQKHCRKAISEHEAITAFVLCEGKCFYCESDLHPFEGRRYRFEIDHKVPVALNGRSEIDNYVSACFECNRTKSGKDLGTWLREVNLRRRCDKLVFSQENGIKLCGNYCTSTRRRHCARHFWVI